MRLRGTGRVEVPAYGIADAEAQVEKELRRVLPGVRIEIPDVARLDAGERIVETFLVAYRVHVETKQEALNEAGALRQALHATRGATAGTRFHRITWETARPRST